MKITKHSKSKKLPSDRDRQKRERCQANMEVEAAGREEAYSQPSRNGGKKNLSLRYTGNYAEFTACASPWELLRETLRREKTSNSDLMYKLLSLL